MNPRHENNLTVVLDEDLSNNQKLEAISSAGETEPSTDYPLRLRALIEHARASAAELDDGIKRVTETGSEGRKPANFIAPPLKIADTARGGLWLSFFIYDPENQDWGQSIYAAWHLKKGKQSKLMLEEYLSDRSFMEGIAAYRPNAPKIIDLLEESLVEYEKARVLKQSLGAGPS